VPVAAELAWERAQAVGMAVNGNADCIVVNCYPFESPEPGWPTLSTDLAPHFNSRCANATCSQACVSFLMLQHCRCKFKISITQNVHTPARNGRADARCLETARNPETRPPIITPQHASAPPPALVASVPSAARPHATRVDVATSPRRHVRRRSWTGTGGACGHGGSAELHRSSGGFGGFGGGGSHGGGFRAVLTKT
jgi:uncharacterized membrane protein YgcG